MSNRKVEYLSPLPDPFLKSDGTRMTPDEWYQNKDAMLRYVVDFLHDGMPPRPEVVTFEHLNPLHSGITGSWLQVSAGTRERQVTFLLQLCIPPCEGPLEAQKFPVLLGGDACFNTLERPTVYEAFKRGYIVARFNRLQLANDLPNARHGGLYDVYPDHRFTAIAAWAWGYSVCVDVLEKLSFADAAEIGITGHSRGGKTVLLAAATDERIKYVCPNNSGCHGASAFRVISTGMGDDAQHRSERLGDMIKNFPHWMGSKLTPYAGREGELPLDMHWLAALIAPRYYFQYDALQDYWANSVGAWQYFMALKECYRYLGCEDHAYIHFRPGEHRQDFPDFTAFMEFMDRAREGKPMPEEWEVNPFPGEKPNFEW